ncbi:hypothetical protein SLE2022_035590 [Rubroshorea leprosula]
MQQPCSSSEMQAMNSLLNPSHQIPLQDLQNAGNTGTHQQIQNPQFDPTSSHDDFLDQMLSSLPSCSWTDLKSPWDPPKSDETAGASNPENNVGFPYDEILALKLRQHQINGGGNQSAMKMMMQQQQQQLMMAGRIGAAGAGAMVRQSAAGDVGGLTVPLSLGSTHPNDIVDGSSFKSANHQGAEGSVQALYNGFGGGSLHGTNQAAPAPNQPQHFNHPQPQGGSMQAQNFGAPGAAVVNQAPAASGSSGGASAGQPRQRVRARRGQATDPHSIAERLRRERIAERMKALQELVPNANKTDKASMLDEIIDYVKFLQLQVKVLSMSRLGGAAAVAPLVADMSSEGGGDCIQTASSNDSLTVTEHQVAKLMEEDMGSAMQYLQGKGLCLMPISLATAISTATCRSRNPLINNAAANNPLLNGEGPSSPSMSVLTVQSATIGVDGSVKDAASVSKP